MKPLLKADGLHLKYPVRGGLLSNVKNWVHAVDHVALEINPGEVVALVGESGCGKSSLGKGLIGLETFSEGTLELFGQNVKLDSRSSWTPLRKDIQMIFQDPASSLNPRLTIGESIAEPMIVHGLCSASQADQRICELLELVELPAESRHRFPHAFSGGQRQRISIARALGLKPKLIVCDEIVSALDVSVQAQILDLLSKLQRELQLSLLFITHDLSVVQAFANRVIVMYLGSLVESGSVEHVFHTPRHPYTKALLDAIPSLDPSRPPKILKGEIPSPLDKPKGCAFSSRCPKADSTCQTQPTWSGNLQTWACHHPLQENDS
jgi:peptide/nickel transport system ATP-binding protein/oligopeptide transport system ATP-binding protein